MATDVQQLQEIDSAHREDMPLLCNLRLNQDRDALK